VVRGVVEGVEDPEDGVVAAVDGDEVVEEVSKEFGKGRWKSEFHEESFVWRSLAVESMLLDMWSGEDKSYARLGITGVCG